MESSKTNEPTPTPVVNPTDRSKEEEAKGNVAEPIGDNHDKGNVVNEPPKPIIAAPENTSAQK